MQVTTVVILVPPEPMLQPREEIVKSYKIEAIQERAFDSLEELPKRESLENRIKPIETTPNSSNTDKAKSSSSSQTPPIPSSESSHPTRPSSSRPITPSHFHQQEGHVPTHPAAQPTHVSHHNGSLHSQPSSFSDPEASEKPSSQDDGNKKSIEKGSDGKVLSKEDEGEKPIENVENLAKQIANELIPEKFNFLTLLAHPFRQQPVTQEVSKEEKPQGEEQAQKSPSSKSQATVKGEAKTIQQAEVAEEIDPVEKTFKAMYPNLKVMMTNVRKEGESPLPRISKEEMGTSKGFETLPAVSIHLAGSTHPQGAKGEVAPPQNYPLSPNQTQNLQPGNPQAPFLQKNIQEQPSSGPLQQPSGMQPAPNRNVPQAINSVNAILTPGDPAKIVKGHQHIGKVPDVADHKHAHPRRDLIPGVDRNENAAAPLRQRHDDDRTVVRIPILPDLPLSREGVLKDSGGKKEGQLKEDEGFKLDDLILMMLCAVICNAKNTTEMAAYLEGREHFFKAWLGLKKGLPTQRLLSLLMKSLKPHYLNQLIQLALGKSLDLTALQSVGVWESDRGFVLAELKGDAEKKMHIPLGEVLELFDLNHAVVTIDSSTLNKNISKQIRGAGGEFLLALKGKHGRAYDDAQEFFASGFNEKRDEIRYDVHRDVMEQRKNTMLREILSVEDVTWFKDLDNWTGLSTSVRLLSETVVENRTLTETRMYLSSMPLDAKAVAKTLRIHTTLENKLAWYLDLDITRGTVDHRQENFDNLRAYGWNLLNLEPTVRAAPEVKSNKAKVDNSYLRAILGTKAA